MTDLAIFLAAFLGTWTAIGLATVAFFGLRAVSRRRQGRDLVAGAEAHLKRRAK